MNDLIVYILLNPSIIIGICVILLLLILWDLYREFRRYYEFQRRQREILQKYDTIKELSDKILKGLNRKGN